MKKSAGVVHIAIADSRCFFHVLGDKNQYYDLESLIQAHPVLEEYCDKNRIRLEIDMLRQRELLGFSEKF